MVAGSVYKGHNRRRVLPLRILPAVLVALSIAPAPRAAQPATADPGITGEVRAPDGSPVTQGTVALMMSATSKVMAAIDRTGHFRILPDAPGWQRLFVSVPGFAPYRANVTVPSSRTMTLPALTLLEPTYFHARLATSDGELLAAGGVRRQSLDIDGALIADPLEHVREQIELDGSFTIGPLWPGRTLMVFNRSPLAQTRLRDLIVTGTKQVIEGGTIPIGPGAQLHVDILDGAGRPVPRHDVWLEDAVQPSPLSFMTVKTNEKGGAVFDRLASGRYRVWTSTADPCGRQLLRISRLVSTGDSGAVQTRLVIGGRAVFRIKSPLGPVSGRGVNLSPDPLPQEPWQARLAGASARRMAVAPTSPRGCGGVTDADGRVVLTPFPPGAAQLRVSLFNSAYIARVAVPAGGREIAIAVPDGLIPVKVTDHTSQQPVQAHVTWVGGGARVEAFATANGDVLLEAVGNTGGTLTISAREHQTLEGSFDQTPETLQEVALVPSPSARVAVRVVDRSGAAVGGAVIEWVARGPADASEFVVADARGMTSFTDVPPGPLQFSVHADGLTPAAVRIPEEGRASIVITLMRITPVAR